MTRVVICTSAHPHDDVRIFHKEAVALAQAGYEVFLLNSQYSGTAACGVRFVQVPTGNSRARRMAASWHRYARAAWKLRPAVCHMHDPELLPAGGYLRRRGVKIIYDAHEDLPKQVLGKLWLPPVLRKAAAGAAGTAEKAMLRRFHLVFCATELIAARFRGITNAVTLHNYPELLEFSQAPPVRERAICYVGALTEARGVIQMVNAAKLAEVPLLLAGRFETQELAAEVLSLIAKGSTKYLGILSREETATLMARCCAGLVVLHPTPAYKESIPIKLLEYMAAGIPAIASDFAHWRGLLKNIGCAIFVNPLDENAIAGAMRTIANTPKQAQILGRNGRHAAQIKFSWGHEKHKLLNAYSALLQ